MTPGVGSGQIGALENAFVARGTYRNCAAASNLHRPGDVFLDRPARQLTNRGGFPGSNTGIRNLLSPMISERRGLVVP